MVIACSTCDDSKGNRPFDKWMLSDKPKSPLSRGIPDISERIRRIKEYVTAYQYAPTPLEQRLNESERSRLSGIQARLKALREEVDTLIADYRGRTGHR